MVLALSGSVIGGSGCAPLLHKSPPKYATVQASPQNNTNEARRHHQLALRYIHKFSHGRRPELNLSKAEDHLQQALVADVRFGPAHNTLGIVYFYQHQLYLAAWEFEYAARLMPDRVEPLNNLGLVYEAAEKLNEAVVYYMEAQQLAPTHPEVVANLARAMFRSGQSVDDMRPVLEDVIALDRRKEWRQWASELLGVNPMELPELTESVIDSPAEPLPVPDGWHSDGDDEEWNQGPVLPPGGRASSDSASRFNWFGRQFHVPGMSSRSERTASSIDEDDD